jgi:hypothetical protein
VAPAHRRGQGHGRAVSDRHEPYNTGARVRCRRCGKVWPGDDNYRYDDEPCAPDRLALDEAAALARVKPATWRAYVARGQAPQRDGRDPETGRPYWFRGTIQQYLAGRTRRATSKERT